MKKLYVSALIFGLSFLPGAVARAQEAPVETTASPNVFISEINWAGSAQSTSDEWIELFNPASESVDLGGWVLTGAATSGDALSIQEGFTVEAEKAVVISNYDQGNPKTTLDLEPDLVTTSLALPNGKLEIMLTTPEGLLVDEVTAEEKVGERDPVSSMTRNDDMTWIESTGSVNLLDAAQLGTPGVHEMEAPEVPKVPVELEEPETPEESTGPCENHPSELEEIASSNEEQPPRNDNVEIEVSADPIPEESEVEITPIHTPPPTAPKPSPAPAPVADPEPVEVEPKTFTEGILLINEVVSDPEDGTEWVEVLNTGDESVNLLDFGMMDGSGKLTIFPNVELGPRDFYIVEDPAGNLNNSGDSIHLFDPTGFVIDEMSYGNDELKAPKKGESLVLIDDEWQITTLITQAAKNALPEPEVEEEIEVEEVPKILEEQDEEISTEPTEQETHRIIAVASEVDPADQEEPKETKPTVLSARKTTLTATVTALPGTFGTQIAFVNGVQLYFHHAEWPELEVGDVITVTGEPSMSRGEDRIKISSSEDVLFMNSSKLTAMNIDIASIPSQKPGALVNISGEVVERDGNTIVLSDGTGEVEVIAHKNTGISFNDLDGSNTTITGVLRKFGNEYRVYPRSTLDIEKKQTQTSFSADDLILPVAQSQSTTPWIGGGLCAVAASALSYWYMKHRGVHLRTA